MKLLDAIHSLIPTYSTKRLYTRVRGTGDIATWDIRNIGTSFGGELCLIVRITRDQSERWANANAQYWAKLTLTRAGWTQTDIPMFGEPMLGEATDRALCYLACNPNLNSYPAEVNDLEFADYPGDLA